jgi:hypothetical protein
MACAVLSRSCVSLRLVTFIAVGLKMPSSWRAVHWCTSAASCWPVVHCDTFGASHRAAHTAAAFRFLPTMLYESANCGALRNTCPGVLWRAPRDCAAMPTTCRGSFVLLSLPLFSCTGRNQQSAAVLWLVQVAAAICKRYENSQFEKDTARRTVLAMRPLAQLSCNHRRAASSILPSVCRVAEPSTEHAVVLSVSTTHSVLDSWRYVTCADVAISLRHVLSSSRPAVVLDRVCAWHARRWDASTWQGS